MIILFEKAAIIMSEINELDIQNDQVIRKDGGEEFFKDLAQIVYYRGHELPAGTNAELISTASFSIEVYHLFLLLVLWAV